MPVRLIVLAAALVVALAVLAAYPTIDVEVAQAIFRWQGGFIGQTELARAARMVFRVLPFVVLFAFAALYVLKRLRFRVPYAPTGAAMIFLIASMAIGPGLIVNLGLKQQSHRPRPIHTVMFGGKSEYRPWYRFDGQCAKYCSFASGEASSAFWLVAPASLAPAPYRIASISGALVVGIAASALRMAFGAHYLSDVVVAALIVLIVMEALRMMLLRRRPTDGLPRPNPARAKPANDHDMDRYRDDADKDGIRAVEDRSEQGA